MVEENFLTQQQANAMTRVKLYDAFKKVKPTVKRTYRVNEVFNELNLEYTQAMCMAEGCDISDMNAQELSMLRARTGTPQFYAHFTPP